MTLTHWRKSWKWKEGGGPTKKKKKPPENKTIKKTIKPPYLKISMNENFTRRG